MYNVYRVKQKFLSHANFIVMLQEEYNLTSLYTDTIGVQWGQGFPIALVVYILSILDTESHTVTSLRAKGDDSHKYKRQTAQCDWSFADYVFVRYYTTWIIFIKYEMFL